MTVGNKRPLLIHAHPGHELRLFRWMEAHQPILFLLTDGSGGGAARTEYSRACALRAGAVPGAVFGLAPDSCWYDAVLSGDLSLFRDVVDAVVETAHAQQSPLLVSDAVDGYNPMHDLCEAIVAAATARLADRGVRTTHLVSRAIAGLGEPPVVEVCVEGDDLRRKREAIEAYSPIAEEAARVLHDEPEALKYERLLQPNFDWSDAWAPDWERIGAERVAAGKYARRINYLRHVRPIARALLDDRDQTTSFEERAACAS